MKGISWLTLMLRWALGLILVFGSLAYVTGWHFYIQDAGKVVPWTSIPASQSYGKILCSVLLLSGIALLAGLGTVLASFTTLAALTLIHAINLVHDPFYNTLNNTVPMFIFATAIWVLAEAGDGLALDRWWTIRTPAFLRRRDDWISLFIRLFVGLIALRQGVGNLSMQGGPLAFADRLYVTPFTGHLPELLLWIAGFSNPFIMTACGLAMCIGLLTRFATGLYLAFLVQIVFGHLMGDPYQASGDQTAYALNSFCFAATAYYRHVRGQDGFAWRRTLSGRSGS